MNLEIQGYTSDHVFDYKSHNTRRGRFSGGISMYYVCKHYVKDKISSIEKKQTSADLNTRTGNVSDMLDFDSYIDSGDGNLSNYIGIQLHSNSDHMIDLRGNIIIKLCKSTWLLIANGRLHKDYIPFKQF